MSQSGGTLLLHSVCDGIHIHMNEYTRGKSMRTKERTNRQTVFNGDDVVEACVPFLFIHIFQTAERENITASHTRTRHLTIPHNV